MNINYGIGQYTRTIISIVIDIQNIGLTQSCIEYGVERTCFSLLLAVISYIFNKFTYIYIIFNKYIYIIIYIYI